MEEEVRVMMALGRTSPAFRLVIGTTVGIGSQGIVFDGTPAQKAQWCSKGLTRRADRQLCADRAGQRIGRRFAAHHRHPGW